MQDKEVEKITGKSAKLKKADKWYEIKNAKEFPTHGKCCFRSQYRKYLDCNKKFAEADAAAPVFWHIHPNKDKNPKDKDPGLECFQIKKKKKVLMGVDSDVFVHGEPAYAEWKAIMKVPGKYLLMNEQGNFLKLDKDGTVSMGPIHDVDDIVACKEYIIDLKLK